MSPAGSGSAHRRRFFVGQAPYNQLENLQLAAGSETAFSAGPHGSAELRLLLPSQYMIELGQNGCNWLGDQLAALGRQELNSRTAGEFDEAEVVLLIFAGTGFECKWIDTSGICWWPILIY